MDKIYSRRRINILKINNLRKENKNAKKILYIILIFTISIYTFYIINKSTQPIFEGLCIEKARAIATIIVNEESGKTLDNINYENLVYFINNEDETSKVLKTDVVKINKIASDIAGNIENRLQDLKNESIKIPLGALFNNKYLYGIGPDIKINIIPTGNVFTEIKTKFEEKGINQTTYGVYLDVICKVQILTPYDTFQDEIINQILLVETLIAGDVPNSYYNLKNSDKDMAVDIIN